MPHPISMSARRTAWVSVAVLGCVMALCDSLIVLSWPSEVMVCLFWGLLIYLLAVQILKRKCPQHDEEIISMLFNDAGNT